MEPSLEQTRQHGLQLVCPCDLKSARECCLSIRAFLESFALDPTELGEWELILAESINNAVVYAPEARQHLPIEVEVSVSEADGMISVWIHDHTDGVEWPEQADLPDPTSEGGRGIYLIQSLTDTADYRRGTNGNSLVMRRRAKNVSLPTNGGDSEKATELQAAVDGLEATLDGMTEELSSCYESLSAIFHFSTQLGENQTTEDFSKQLLNHVLQITEADWFVFRQHFSDSGRLMLLSASDSALELEALAVEDGGGDTSGIELQAVGSRQDEWLAADEALAESEPLKQVAEGCHVMVHPIFLNDALLGVLSVGRNGQMEPFKAAQISFINTFAEFLAIQIVNVGYERERISKGIFKRELEIAQNIQRSLLPRVLPDHCGFELVGSCESAREVGGDFYDVIFLGGGDVVLVIADVMGKGVPAALFAAILRSLVRAMPAACREPGRLMESLNRIMYEDLTGVDMFITAQVVFLDAREGVVKVANAGHCPALVRADGDEAVAAVCPEGMPIGVLDDSEYEESVISLGKAPRLMIYTDGITEAANLENEQFGDDRLREWFANAEQGAGSAEGLKIDLLETVRNHVGAAAVRDDQTFILVTKSEG